MDEDDLEPPKPPLSGLKCPRCFEPLPVGARRCPRCRQSTGELPRSLPVILLLAGILTVVFLAIMVYRTSVAAQVQPPPAEEAPSGFAPAPETSAGHESPPPTPPATGNPPAPAAPEKKPPLDR